MGKAHKELQRVMDSFELADRRLRRACARAVQEGVPLRAIAQFSGVSHVTVRKWVASVPPEDLPRYARLDGVSVPLPKITKPLRKLDGRPGLSGRRSARRKR